MKYSPSGNRGPAGVGQNRIGQFHLNGSFLSISNGVCRDSDNLGTGICDFLIIRLQLTELCFAIPSVVCAVKDDENVLLTFEVLDVHGGALNRKTHKLWSRGWRLQGK